MKIVFKKKGSVTIEAALVLPVFLCVAISLFFMIKAIYTHKLVQHAINETANEMAASGYILHISGLGQLDSRLDSGMENRAQTFKNHINNVFEGFNSLGSLFEMQETIENAAANPLDELKNIACLLAKGAYDDFKTSLFIPLAKLYMGKYLESGSSQTADERLRALNIRNGLNGLDFSRSDFLCDESNSIDIVVEYTIDLPVPIKIVPEFRLMQRAFARAWMGGDEASPAIDEDKGEDIWALDNFARGIKIRSIFGADLPSSFPVIAKFENGKAVMIKSMDLTAVSYKNTENISDTLGEYLSGLNAFKGQEEPWGSSKIIIRQEDVKQKELLLVIPENTLSPQTEMILAEFKGKASSMGISLVIERYGIKKTEAP